MSANDVTRLEGASDPSDQVMIVPLRCTSCATPGTLVLKFGPEASIDETEVLLELHRVAHAGGLLRPSPGVATLAMPLAHAPAASVETPRD